MNRKQFLFLAGAVALLALLVREYYVLVSQVNNPYSGDPREYITYAHHMLQGWFGLGDLPDAYRSPGYPFLLYLTMLAEGDWYPRALQVQAVLGTLTVIGVMGIARHWLSRGWALLAGLLLALWPHHIMASAELWSEILFGCTLVGALWLSVVALDRRTTTPAVMAGAAFGLAFLVNPLIALFPFAIAAMFWRGGMPRQGAALVLASLVAVGGWGIRNTNVSDDGSERAYVNLVQGSYPLYHSAFNNRFKEPMAMEVMNAIDADVALMLRDKAAGLHSIATRMQREPFVFTRWYLSKPLLLLDKQVRIGEHDVYKSPLVIHPLLRATTAILNAVNPLLSILALGFAVIALWAGPAPVRAAGLLLLYVTGVHTVLQAEPRYAIAYRPIEMLLVVTALAMIAERIGMLRRTPVRFSRSVQTSSVTGVTAGASPRISPPLMKA